MGRHFDPMLFRYSFATEHKTLARLTNLQLMGTIAQIAIGYFR